MVRISGVINTLNESSNIRYALGSLLPWCDEVIVLDQHSEDGTAAIAAEMGARVVQHERTGHRGGGARGRGGPDHWWLDHHPGRGRDGARATRAAVARHGGR